MLKMHAEAKTACYNLKTEKMDNQVALMETSETTSNTILTATPDNTNTRQQHHQETATPSNQVTEVPSTPDSALMQEKQKATINWQSCSNNCEVVWEEQRERVATAFLCHDNEALVGGWRGLLDIKKLLHKWHHGRQQCRWN